MTQHHTLAATIARAIFDRIERDRTLILQNIEETIRDQLAIEGARRAPAMDQPWGSIWPITGRTDKGSDEPTPRRRKSLPEMVADRESSRKWWLENAEGFYGDDWK